MTPIRYPRDFTPWKPGRIIGFAGTWLPSWGDELHRVALADAAILKAIITSAQTHGDRNYGDARNIVARDGQAARRYSDWRDNFKRGRSNG